MSQSLQQVPVPRRRPANLGGQDAAAVEQQPADQGNLANQQDAGLAGADQGGDQTPRQRFIADYRTFLEARRDEAAALTGEDKVRRIEGLLLQVEQVSSELAAGRVPVLADLSTTPDSGGDTASEVSSFVPPELVPVVRGLISTLEVGVADGEEVEQPTVEGSQHSADEWNSRLGVPQYRTQSDNLAAPEATCNTTSFSMVLERLGISRGQVMEAVERQLKRRLLRSQGREDWRTAPIDEVELSDDQWETEIRAYLDAQQSDSARYRRLRGQDTTGAQRDTIAGLFRENAQMEDVVDFLLRLLGISRYEITGNADTVLRNIVPEEGERPTTELLENNSRNPWSTVRETLKGVLDAGGGAMLSLYHKGQGQTGTHILTVQQVTPGGVVVDDPYGQIRDTYRRNRRGDAYAAPGSTRGASNYRNVKHIDDQDGDGIDDDWHASAAQDLDADESRGESVEMEDAQIENIWRYVKLFRRAAGAAETPEGG